MYFYYFKLKNTRKAKVFLNRSGIASFGNSVKTGTDDRCECLPDKRYHVFFISFIKSAVFFDYASRSKGELCTRIILLYLTQNSSECQYSHVTLLVHVKLIM